VAIQSHVASWIASEDYLLAKTKLLIFLANKKHDNFVLEKMFVGSSYEISYYP
jgi:hypothetical protein